MRNIASGLVVVALVGLIGGCGGQGGQDESESCSLAPVACPLDAGAQNVCDDFMGCWLPCEGDEQCRGCVQDLRLDRGFEDGAVVGFDLGMCAVQYCYAECNGAGASSDECGWCLDRQCGDLVAVCEGRASYPDVGGYSCWDARVCTGQCAEDDADCVFDCYWAQSPWARAHYWQMLDVIWGPCAETCASPEGHCSTCVDAYLGDDWDMYSSMVEGCLDPGPASAPTGCEGLDGVALCMCATNDSSMCASM